MRYINQHGDPHALFRMYVYVFALQICQFGVFPTKKSSNYEALVDYDEAHRQWTHTHTHKNNEYLRAFNVDAMSVRFLFVGVVVVVVPTAWLC